MFTMDNTEGFTQSQLNEMNLVHEQFMVESEPMDDWTREQFSKNLSDIINNEWPADDLEAAVRKRLGR